MRYEFSCHGCDKRTPGCHGSCETYKQERAEYDAKKAEIDNKKAIRDGTYKQREVAVARAIRRKISNRNSGRKD